MKPLNVTIPDALLTKRMARRIRIALDAGLGQRPDVDVALDLGISAGTVADYRKVLGIGHTAEGIQQAVGRRNICGETDDELAASIRRFADRGYSRYAIALRLHAGPQRIMRVAEAHGIALPKFGVDRRGKAAGRARGTLPWGAARRTRTYATTFDRLVRDIDWSLRDEEIARKIGESAQSVKTLRHTLRVRGFAMPTQPRNPYFRKPDWRSVDWSKPNAEIAMQHRVEERTVALWRRQFRAEGHPIPQAPDPRRLAWTKKWSRHVPRIRVLARKGLTASAIARRLRIDYGVVHRIAAETGIAVVAGREPVDWNTVDWSRSNRKIAETVGITVAGVATMRSRLRRKGVLVQRDPTDPHGRWRGRMREMEEAVRVLAAKGFYLAQIARELGVAPVTAQQAAKRAGIRLPSAQKWTKAQRDATGDGRPDGE